jgi:signal transduction histidine kinase
VGVVLENDEPIVSADEAVRVGANYRDLVKNRLIALVRSHAVDVLVVIAAVGAYVELEAMRDNYGDFQDHPPLGVPLWQLGLGAFALPLPLLARRWFPLAAPVTTMAAAGAISFLDARIIASSGFLLLAALGAVFLFGWLEDARVAVGGLAVALAAATLVEVNHPGTGTGDYVFVWVMFGLVWLAGFSLRQRLQRASEAELRAEHAVADERARIARELHDIIAHSISVMTVQASGVRRLLREDQEREREALLAVERTGRESLTEMRRLLGILRGANESPELTPQPGLGALDRLARESESTGLPVEVRVEGEPYYVPAGIDVAAFRIVQEALTNARKHGGEGRADVVVRYRPDALELEVTNVGRDDAQSDGTRRGLAGMRERVAFYGGTVDAKPRLGGGYVVRARIPVRREEAAWASA